MIIFKEDWDKYDAVVHENTKNLSFVRICMVLKRLGVSNYLFPLALHQPDLAKYDPCNLKDTSEELCARIALECRYNIWYYFREVLRVQAAGSDPINFVANRGAIAMIWSFINNIDYISIQPRQTGKAQPLDSLIKTPSGWVRMGDIRLGAVVSTPDGVSARVVGIYPQGVKAIYRVTLDDGRSADCCLDHLWKIYTGTWEVVTLSDIIARLACEQHNPVLIPIALGDNTSAGISLQAISSVRYIEDAHAQCIAIDHPEHLYITNDNIVTHNTIGATSIMSWVMYIGGYNVDITMLTKDTKLLQANVARLKTIREHLPDYLIHKQMSDTDNKEGLSYTALGTKYLTCVAQSDKQGADNLGRGQTSPINHIDEPAYCTNIDITYPVMMFATTAAIASAKAAGQPHSNILTTTAGRIDTTRGRYAFDLVNGAMPFTEKLYDCRDKSELKAIIAKNSTNNMLNGTFSYLMLGYTHEWFLDVIKKTSATQEEIDRDLLNMWKSGSELGLIDAATLKRMDDNKSEPIHTEIIQGYAVSWYLSRDTVSSSLFKSRHFVLGMDSSENIGRDFTALVLIDITDMAVVATFRCNESNTIKLGMFIADFLMRHRNVTFIPENNSTGRTIVDTIITVFQKYTINPFRRIYSRIVQERDTEEFRDVKIDDPSILDTSIRKYLGFRTSGKTRDFLYKHTLTKAAELNAVRVFDATLINELSALTSVNGRIDHTEGNHDDTVIAWLLACWFLFEGRNLDYYGINKSQVLCKLTMSGTEIDPEHRNRQLELRKLIKQTKDMIAATQLSTTRNQYIQRLNALMQYLDDSIILEPISASKMDSDIREYGDVYTTGTAHVEHARTITPLDLSRIL